VKTRGGGATAFLQLLIVIRPAHNFGYGRRGLEKLAAMDVDAKDKEILFLRDRVFQLQTQVSILKKRTGALFIR